MARDDLFRPGQPAPQSGQYEMTGPRGGATGIERTAVRDKPLPPTLKAGQQYRLVDPTQTQGRKQ